uniref:Uncharacterized protein n=1 Tax=Megaselia scalaris TaxID=36166 RepID=T1GZA7_MEGSC
VLSILSLIIVEIYCFDKNIKISDLAGCRELLLDRDLNLRNWNFPIKYFMNNKPKSNERFRMKFYAIGYDLYFFFKTADAIPHDYLAVLSGFSRATCQFQSEVTGKTVYLQTVNCQNLTDTIFYTEFDLVITKDNQLQFFKKGESVPFLSNDARGTPEITHLAFTRYYHETVDGRLFFDCP